MIRERVLWFWIYLVGVIVMGVVGVQGGEIFGFLPPAIPGAIFFMLALHEAMKLGWIKKQ